MKNNLKIIASVTGGILGISAALWYYQSSKQNKFSKEEIYTIMKDLKGQLFSIWVQVADIRNKVVAENNNNDVMNGKKLKDILAEQTKALIQSKKKMICIKYQIDEEELDDYVDETYVNEESIQKISDEISECFYQAIEGVKPKLNLKQQTIDQLPQDKVLFLYEKILRECGKKLQTGYSELIQQGDTDFSLNNPQFIQKIKSLQLGKMKNELLVGYGMDFPEEPDSPTAILSKIRSKYQQENDTFNEKVTALDKKYEEFMDALTLSDTQSPVDEQLCEKLFGSEQEFQNNNSQFLTSSVQLQQQQQ